jgi:hypothetical protein
MTVATPSQVEAYLDELRTHLESLPDQEREELLGDLSAHLSEVAAETSEPLSAVVGPPDAFARELLASAGAPPSAPRRRRRPPNPLAAIARSPAWQAAEPTLQLLRPAWWVLRGWIAALAFSGVTGDGTLDSFPLPMLFGSRFLGFIELVAAIAGSVALGVRTPPRLRWVLLVPNVALVAAGFVAADRVNASLHRISYPLVQPVPPFLNEAGRVIGNIYPYSVDGRPLHHVLLYDENGIPIENVAGSSGFVYARDRNGNAILNEYPIPDLEVVSTPLGGTKLRAARGPAVVVPPRAALRKPDQATGGR